MKRAVLGLTLALSVALGSCQHPDAGRSSDRPTAEQARKLIFSDEFDDATLDRSKWIAVGKDFWVNDEQQAYADDPATIAISDEVPGADGGALVLRPVFRPGEDTRDDRKADFLSGRIETRGKFDFTHGRAEARIRMPDSVGVWPAFWLLGNGEWPATGEIDIMEYVGEQDWTGVALHGPGYSGETPFVNKYIFPDGGDVTGWHVYAVEWSDKDIVFEVDGQPTYRVTRAMVDHYGMWSFDNPKHLILNFAVGGAYPLKTNGIREPYTGVPAATVDAIKRGEVAMEVDWVRVYAPD